MTMKDWKAKEQALDAKIREAKYYYRLYEQSKKEAARMEGELQKQFHFESIDE